MKKSLFDSIFLQLYIVRKQLILNFHLNTLKRQCILVNQILMNLNHSFRFPEPLKSFRCFIFATKTFDNYLIVRPKHNRKMRTVFHSIYVIVEPTRHQKPKIKWFFAIIKALAYMTSYIQHGRISRWKVLWVLLLFQILFSKRKIQEVRRKLFLKFQELTTRSRIKIL